MVGVVCCCASAGSCCTTDLPSLSPLLHLQVGSKLFMVTQFEAPQPGSMVGSMALKGGAAALPRPSRTADPRSPAGFVLQYVVELNQDATTGALTPMSINPVDFSEYGGLSGPCAGSTTPWNTHLGSEEGDPDQKAFDLVRASVCTLQQSCFARRQRCCALAPC